MLFMADLLPNGLHEKVMICSICSVTKSRLDVQFVKKIRTVISYAVVQCLSLLHSFAKYSQNPGSVHCRFVQIFDKDLKCLIDLGYWGTKDWKHLVFEKDAKFCGTEVCKAEKVRKWFLNPKMEVEI